MDSEAIDQQVTTTSAGNYALGYSFNDTFYVKYVGRADSNLNQRLKNWEGKYDEFKFSYATSPKTAFDEECRNYHDFGGKDELDNDIHPDRPNNSSWKCPKCNVFD